MITDMIGTLLKFTKSAANLLYPLHCKACNRPLDPLVDAPVCEACVKRIRVNPKPYCRSCGRSVDSHEAKCQSCRKSGHSFERAYSAHIYEGVLKELIHSFKYKEQVRLTGILSGFLIDFVKNNPEVIGDIDLVTFVPKYKDMFANRPFNQSQILAKNLSCEFNIGAAGTLKKRFRTKHQNDLPRSQRLVNLKDAFRVRAASSIAGLCVLLIDDVMTTGATLDECSRALISGGVKSVRCLTLARGI